MSDVTSINKSAALPALGLMTEHSEMNPSRYETMRSNLQKDRDIFSEPGSPTGARRSLGMQLQKASGARSFSRSSRLAGSASRRSSFIHSHRQKMSAEHFSQAERSFMSLMEIMASATKEAGSLKEYWSRLMADRESFDSERESFLTQIDELTGSVEHLELEQESQKRHVGDRKQEVARLLNELSTASATIVELKKKLADRESSTHHTHTEVTEIRTSLSRAQYDYENLQAQYDSAQSKVRASEDELARTREEVERYRSDYRSLSRELADLKTRNGDLTSAMEASRSEVQVLTERSRALELEKAGVFAEKDRMHFDVRKHVSRNEDLSRELASMTEKYNRSQRELYQTKESLHTAELDRDEHVSTADRFREEVRDKSLALEKVEAEHSDLLVKLEQESRKITSKDELIAEKETQINSLQQRLTSKQDETRLVIIERDQLRDDLERERHSAHDHRLKITGLEERLAQAEARVTAVRSESHTATERITSIERERDERREHNGELTAEIRTLHDKIARLHEEIHTITDDRDHIRSELETFRSKYDEVTETTTTWQDDTAELQYEIESLSIMLREAREQKEAAIRARNAADDERDRSTSMYEEKCRELERLADSSSHASFSRSHTHSHGRAGGGARSSSVRIFSRGSTAASHNQTDVDGAGENSFTS